MRWGGAQRNLSNLTVPRIRLWPSDDELLVFIGIADGHCDPVVGIDLYVTGRLGNWLSGWLWERGRCRSTSHRHLITRHRHPDWHGHCDPEKRGYKRCDRQHWHLWWRHDNHATSLPDGVAASCWKCNSWAEDNTGEALAIGWLHRIESVDSGGAA